MSRALKVCDAINRIYPQVKLCGGKGAYQVSFKVPPDDTKHIWLMLLLKDAKDIKSVKQPNGPS